MHNRREELRTVKVTQAVGKDIKLWMVTNHGEQFAAGKEF